MFLLIAYYVIFYMCLLFTLWRMNKYQSINQSIKKHVSYAYMMANIRSDTVHMSFMEIIKRREPKIKPCGTTCTTTLVSDLEIAFKA